jgi:HK97 family phage major capsid protein
MLTAEEQKAIAEELGSVFNTVMEEKLTPLIGKISAETVREQVEKLAIQRMVYGKDVTGLDASVKKDFAKAVQAVANNKMTIDTKANEALLEEQDNRGGYLVSAEVAAAILRIAASVGTILSQTTKWTLKTDELAIPNYTGSYLTGSYIGVDVAGTIQGLAFGAALLIAKKWQLAFAVGNDLLADANVQVADWLLAMAGEALANMIDKQGFTGIGAPFVGILSLSSAETPSGQQTFKYYLGGSSASTKDDFTDYKVMDDSSAMIGLLEESILDGAAFYMHRSVWANLRVQQDGAQHYILPYAGIVPGILTDVPNGGPIKPAGEILGHKVYTNRWMPALSASAVSTPFVIFGNMKAAAFGDRGEMSVEQFTSGAFGGKEIALADQRGIVYKHRHAFVIALAQAFVVATTTASD